MARNVNVSFSGVVVSDVDPNALTRTRWLDESVADTALVHDLITGENTPPATLDHSGPGNGCVLGIPVANQATPRYTLSGHLGNRILWAVPFMQPAGETTMGARVTFDVGFPNDTFLEIMDTSWAVVASAPLIRLGVSGSFEATATGLTENTAYFARIASLETSPTGYIGSYNLTGIAMGYFRKAPATRALIRRLTSDVEDSTELSTKTASSATVIDFVDLDTAETQDGQAISGYHTTTLAQNQHALAEMLTGAPAGTNSSRTLAASATQATHYDHGRLGSEWASMPLVRRIPLFAFGLGLAPYDGGNGTDGAGGFSSNKKCPGWTAAASVGTSYRNLLSTTCWMPYHTQSTLRVQVLAYSPDGALGGLTTPDVQITVINANSGATVDTQAAGTTPTQMGSTNWYYWDVTGIDFVQAGANRIEAAFSIATPDAPKVNGGTLRIAGWSACLEGA